MIKCYAWGKKKLGTTVTSDGNIMLQITLFFTFPDKSSSADTEDNDDRSAGGNAAVVVNNGANYVNLMADGLSLVTHV